MRGRDIRHLQGVLNDRLRHYRSRTRLKTDGQFGPGTLHALNAVGYTMGLESPYTRPAAINLILHPRLRNRAQLARERQRLRAKAHAHAHPSVHGSRGLAALPAIASRYVGVHEHPPGSNWGYPTPANWLRGFGLGPAPWCGAFAGSMIRLAGGHVSSRVTYCPFIEADARTHTNGFNGWVSHHSQAGPGWLALFDWGGGGGSPDHVEIVKAIYPDHVVCVGGNTGGSNPSWGGMVGIERRSYGPIVGYARPRL